LKVRASNLDKAEKGRWPERQKKKRGNRITPENKEVTMKRYSLTRVKESMKKNLMTQRGKKKKIPKHPQGKESSSQEQCWACHPDSPYRLKGCSSGARKSCPDWQDQARGRRDFARAKFLRTKVLELAEEGIVPIQAVKSVKKMTEPAKWGNPSYDDYWLVPRKERENSRN